MFYRLILSFYKLLMTKQILRVFLKQFFYQSRYHANNLWSIMILQSTPFILYLEPLSMMITIISPHCLHGICHISTCILYSPAHYIYFKCSFWWSLLISYAISYSCYYYLKGPEPTVLFYLQFYLIYLYCSSFVSLIFSLKHERRKILCCFISPWHWSVLLED